MTFVYVNASVPYPIDFKKLTGGQYELTQRLNHSRRSVEIDQLVTSRLIVEKCPGSDLEVPKAKLTESDIPR